MSDEGDEIGKNRELGWERPRQFVVMDLDFEKLFFYSNVRQGTGELSAVEVEVLKLREVIEGRNVTFEVVVVEGEALKLQDVIETWNLPTKFVLK